MISHWSISKLIEVFWSLLSEIWGTRVTTLELEWCVPLFFSFSWDVLETSDLLMHLQQKVIHFCLINMKQSYCLGFILWKNTVKYSYVFYHAKKKQKTNAVYYFLVEWTLPEPKHLLLGCCYFVGQISPEETAAAPTGSAQPQNLGSLSQPQLRPGESSQSRPTAEATTPETGSLPPGWEVRSAPNGRPFFIDHNTKTTTWVSI